MRKPGSLRFARGAEGATRSTCRVALGDMLWHKWTMASVGDGSRQRDVMKNGLYSIHVTLLDGRVGKGSGVILFRDGQILGGDAYLFYTGSYTVKDDTFKGEVLVQRHTSPKANDNPLFDVEAGEVHSGGNFAGGHVAFLADSLKTAVASVADLLDRQFELIVDEKTFSVCSSTKAIPTR